ncbi:MAG: hypothetical protein MZV70_19255 [Desulfobacterales bacterium]|nr:hypothetical protein [Desulfobacterales bacterium]
MACRKRPEDHPNHERWLVSYADFITLLFAFFVMLYAHSNTNKAMAQQISESFREAMAQGWLTQTLTKLLSADATSPHLRQSSAPAAERPQSGVTIELLPSLRQLNEQLKKEIDAGRLEVRPERRGLVISLKEAAFFPPGNDTVQAAALPTLATIAAELNRTPNPIRLEGHTDSVPISTDRFPTTGTRLRRAQSRCLISSPPAWASRPNAWPWSASQTPRPSRQMKRRKEGPETAALTSSSSTRRRPSPNRTAPRPHPRTGISSEC